MRRTNNGALAALALAGGLWAWRNRDKIQGWLNSQRTQFGGGQSFTGETRRMQENELPSYDTVNVRLGLDNPHWMFLLYCKNLTDKRGITVYNNTGTGGFNGFGGSIGVVQPRTIGATITAKF